MKELTAVRKNNKPLIGGWVIRGVVIVAVFFIIGQAMAQNVPDNAQKNETQKSPANINDYFRGKYNFKPWGKVSSTVRPTQYGPKGRLGLVGVEIIPENPVAIPGEHGQARGVAHKFIETEAEVLGITNMGEIREYEVITGDNESFVNVFYHRYIGDLELAIGRASAVEARIRVTVMPNKTIAGFDADLVAVPPEAYAATNKKTLPDSKIRHIIEMDLKTNKVPQGDWQELVFKKYAVPDAPYVVFRVQNVWIYTIDAFTGEILKKGPGWRN